MTAGKTRRRYSCHACGGQGHSSMTCPRKRDEGELAALIFAALEDDPPWDMAKIVRAFKVTPTFARAMKAEHEAGWSAPRLAAVIPVKTRAQVEVLARKERIEAVKLEAAEVKERGKLDRTSQRAETERAKLHARTLEAIHGGRS